MGQRAIELWIKRYNPQGANSPYFQTYAVLPYPGMTLLDALTYIKENLDTTLAFRASCRMGICGSCAVMVNGFPRLACHTQIMEMKEARLVIAPLANFPVVRDLVVDLEPLFAKHREIKPYLTGEASGQETKQLPAELEAYLQFAYCLKCGICWAACPTAAVNKNFLGPQALAQAYRYAADSREKEPLAHLEAAAGPHGAWRCHFAGNCSKACPKGVDPALGVQLLKRALAWSRPRQAVGCRSLAPAAQADRLKAGT